MDFKAYIFDLDGTLLDTLPDLVRLTNSVLQQRGWPERTREEILSYVGDGGRMLLKRAAPPGTGDAQIDEAFACWEKLYPTLGHEFTKPYEGIPEALATLKAQGAKLGVLSNKFDAAVKQVIGDHFPGIFDIARGECAEIPRKPDPQGLRFMMQQLGVTPQQTAYVGDSATDIQVSNAAGTFTVGVTWGYNSAQDIKAAGPQALISAPRELLAL